MISKAQLCLANCFLAVCVGGRHINGHEGAVLVVDSFLAQPQIFRQQLQYRENQQQASSAVEIGIVIILATELRHVLSDEACSQLGVWGTPA